MDGTKVQTINDVNYHWIIVELFLLPGRLQGFSCSFSTFSDNNSTNKGFFVHFLFGKLKPIQFFFLWILLSVKSVSMERKWIGGNWLPGMSLV